MFQGLRSTFEVNTIGPLIMAKYFAPLLMKGSGTFGMKSEDTKLQHAAVLVNMSAKVGSISDNGRFTKPRACEIKEVKIILFILWQHCVDNIFFKILKWRVHNFYFQMEF